MVPATSTWLSEQHRGRGVYTDGRGHRLLTHVDFTIIILREVICSPVRQRAVVHRVFRVSSLGYACPPSGSKWGWNQWYCDDISKTGVETSAGDGLFTCYLVLCGDL